VCSSDLEEGVGADAGRGAGGKAEHESGPENESVHDATGMKGQRTAG
jgi:hypothetical protein